MKTYKHLTQEERYTIERMRKEGYTQAQISECIERDESTISRELRRNSGQRSYRHKQAQRKAEDRRGRIQNRVSIEERPSVVEKRFYYGDWEVDLVEGAGHDGFLLTLVERKCGHLLMHPLSSKKADEVTTAIMVELWPFVGKIRSLTMDNGKEFSGHETVAAILQTKVYFAHPYASWERGSNENTNGLIRQYLPKGTSFKNLDMALCKEIERKLNSRPRKRLDFAAPIDYRDKLIAS